ncbi:MAG: mannonate dehydratase [Armatimonadota bacterium]
MRWYGPNDGVSLRDIRQAGCTGVVTALHQIPVGDVWPDEDIAERRKLIERAGMTWTVIESLPVHDSIKKGDSSRDELIEKYQQSIRNVAKQGLKVITYNFMPVLDWLRTDLEYPMPDGSLALRFEKAAFIAFDVFQLRRPNAANDYTPEELLAADQWFDEATENQREKLRFSCMQGLPGSTKMFTREEVLEALAEYGEMSAETLRENLLYFLNAVCPVAEEEGVVMAVHPDDPPMPVLGLPRIVSTADDLRALLSGCESPANGLCFCTGSLGASPTNDVPGMLLEFMDRVHFFHLRNTARDSVGNFFEADHLDGDTDMAAVIKTLVQANRSIPMRPDHGHLMMDDLTKSGLYPGYGVIGRMRGLAELRGLEAGIRAMI